jgi:hypothetical protein
MAGLVVGAAAAALVMLGRARPEVA